MKASLTLVLLLLAASASAARKAMAPQQKSDKVAHPEAEAKQLSCGSDECYGFFGEYGYLAWQCSEYEYAFYEVRTGCNCCIPAPYYPPQYACSGQCIGFYGYFGYLTFQCTEHPIYDRLTGCYCCLPEYRK